MSALLGIIENPQIHDALLTLVDAQPLESYSIVSWVAQTWTKVFPMMELLSSDKQ